MTISSNVSGLLARPLRVCVCMCGASLTAWLRLVMAKCARGEHQVSRKYGVVGIIFGVALFPVGMLAMLWVLVSP